jgi:hypothetical protein
MCLGSLAHRIFGSFVKNRYGSCVTHPGADSPEGDSFRNHFDYTTNILVKERYSHRIPALIVQAKPIFANMVLRSPPEFRIIADQVPLPPYDHSFLSAIHSNCYVIISHEIVHFHRIPIGLYEHSVFTICEEHGNNMRLVLWTHSCEAGQPFLAHEIEQFLSGLRH